MVEDERRDVSLLLSREVHTSDGEEGKEGARGVDDGGRRDLTEYRKRSSFSVVTLDQRERQTGVREFTRVFGRVSRFDHTRIP